MFNRSSVIFATYVATWLGTAQAQAGRPPAETFAAATLPENGLWFEDLDLTHMVASDGKTVARKAINGH